MTHAALFLSVFRVHSLIQHQEVHCPISKKIFLDGCKCHRQQWQKTNESIWSTVHSWRAPVSLCEGTDSSCTRCQRWIKSKLVLKSSSNTHHVFFCLILNQCSTSPLLKSNESDEDTQEVYVKKPPNAFMLFMTQQRPNVSKQFWRKGSGVVNSHLAAIVRLFYSLLSSLKVRLCRLANREFCLCSLVYSGGPCPKKSSPHILKWQMKWGSFINRTTRPGPPRQTM